MAFDMRIKYFVTGWGFSWKELHHMTLASPLRLDEGGCMKLAPCISGWRDFPDKADCKLQPGARRMF